MLIWGVNNLSYSFPIIYWQKRLKIPRSQVPFLLRLHHPHLPLPRKALRQLPKNLFLTFSSRIPSFPQAWPFFKLFDNQFSPRAKRALPLGLSERDCPLSTSSAIEFTRMTKRMNRTNLPHSFRWPRSMTFWITPPQGSQIPICPSCCCSFAFYAGSTWAGNRSIHTNSFPIPLAYPFMILSITKSTRNSLANFRILWALEGFPLPIFHMISHSLTHKMNNSQAFPSWCKKLAFSCPFLFFFEARCLYLRSTSFGIARALSVSPQIFILPFCSLFSLTISANSTFKIPRWIPCLIPVKKPFE